MLPNISLTGPSFNDNGGLIRTSSSFRLWSSFQSGTLWLPNQNFDNWTEEQSAQNYHAEALDQSALVYNQEGYDDFYYGKRINFILTCKDHRWFIFLSRQLSRGHCRKASKRNVWGFPSSRSEIYIAAQTFSSYKQPTRNREWANQWHLKEIFSHHKGICHRDCCCVE